MTSIIVQYTNAYDIYSADALSELKQVGNIHGFTFAESGFYLLVNNINPVIECLNSFGFTYQVL